jgi:hypothetical protein
MLRIEVVTAHSGLETRADLDIPVNIEKQGQGQSHDGKDKNKYGVEKPLQSHDHSAVIHRSALQSTG